MSNIATLSVSLVANTARFSQALVAANTSAKKNTNEIGKSLAGIGSAAGGIMTQGLQIGLGAVTALGAGIIANTMDTAKNVKEQVNLARQIGVNVNRYRALTSQLATFGVSADDAWSALKDLNLKISELAITGGGAFKDLTDSVNIDLKRWNMAGPMEQLQMFADATKDMSENNRRQFADALGSDALLKVMDALKASGKSVNDIIQDYKAMGGFVTETDIALLNSASKTWEKLGLQISIIRERFGVAFAPVLEPIMKMASDYLLEIESKEGGLRKWALDTAKAITCTVYDVMEFLVNTFQNIYRAVVEVHNAWANMPGTDAEPIKLEMTTGELEKQLKERSEELAKAEQSLTKALTARDVTKKVMSEKPLPELYNIRLNNNNDTVNKRQSEVDALLLSIQSLKGQISTSVDSGFAGGLKSSREKTLKFFEDLEKDIANNAGSAVSTATSPTSVNNGTGEDTSGTGRKDALAEYNAMIAGAAGARATIENTYKESLLKIAEQRKNGFLNEAEETKAQAIMLADYNKQILDNKIGTLEQLGLAEDANALRFQSRLNEINKLEQQGEITSAKAGEARLQLGEEIAEQERSYVQEKIDLLSKLGLVEKSNSMQRKLDMQELADQQAAGLITEEDANAARIEMAQAEALERANKLEALGLETEALQIKQEIELENLAQAFEDKLITEQEYLDARAEMESEHFEAQREVWAESLSGFQEDMWGMWESISDGVGESFANMMVNGDDFGKSMQNIFKQMAVQYIAEKVKMFLIDKMYAAIAGKTNAKAAAAKGTEKVAEASLNALTSFAAAPWPINVGAPAFAAMIGGLAGGMAGGMTAAASAGASVIGQFHNGGEIPSTGTAYVEKGEIIIPKHEAKAIGNLKSLKSNDTQSKPNMNVTFQISAIDSKSVIDQMDSIEGYLQEMIEKHST
ncbi:hypothetical protein [Shewanella scandinavica]|uniref:hypothetical protein n=1 Tax=Shewanella scandinavica TaxID=3063538 RepID=UPI00318F2696